jgi:hypothetical protein
MLIREPEGGVTFTWYLKDEHTIAIGRLIVHGLRRNGEGKRTYETWERSIPRQITKVELWSKNPEATAFWSAMGFRDDHNLNNEDGSCCMSKIIEHPKLEISSAAAEVLGVDASDVAPEHGQSTTSFDSYPFSA